MINGSHFMRVTSYRAGAIFCSAKIKEFHAHPKWLCSFDHPLRSFTNCPESEEEVHRHDWFGSEAVPTRERERCAGSGETAGEISICRNAAARSRIDRHRTKDGRQAG